MLLPKFKSKYVTIGGHRHYSIEGRVYPGVTTFLGETKSTEDKARLNKWKAKQTPKSLELPRQRGTCVHSMLEFDLSKKFDYLPRFNVAKFLKNTPPNIRAIAKPYYEMLKPKLEALTDVKLVEGSVWYDISENVGYAGKPDCVAILDKKLTLIDWKTSKQIKTQYYLKDYKIQVSLYVYAIRQRYNIELDRACIYIGIPNMLVQRELLEKDDIEKYAQQGLERFAQYQQRRVQ